MCDGKTLSIALQCQTVSPPQCAALGAGSWWLRPQDAVGGSYPTGTGGSDPAHAWRVQCTACGMQMGKLKWGKAPAQAPALVAQTPRVAEAETPMPPPPRRPPPMLEPAPAAPAHSNVLLWRVRLVRSIRAMIMMMSWLCQWSFTPRVKAPRACDCSL